VNSAALRIGIIASATQTVAEPFAGGMEAHTAALARCLRRQGHEVTIHAADRRGEGIEPIAAGAGQLRLSRFAREDVSMPPQPFMAEHHAYLSLMLELDERGYDVVHNNCLHYLPVAMAGALRTPVVTTLHTPPTPWLESAIRCGRDGVSRWVSVSHANASAWAPLCGGCEVIHNGVSTADWRFSPAAGSETAVWSGRIVPEKGLHLAIAAASRLGIELAVAGPIGDRAYYRHCMEGAGPGVSYRGHLGSASLADLVGQAAVCMVTPCWEEPFGLVAIEALSCGTPVAAFRRGALPEIVDGDTGALAAPYDVADLAAKTAVAMGRDRGACRARAERSFSLEPMTRRYLAAYRTLR
jgi:glycosyltransferase involved in cell wall biosynthesis